MLLSELVLNMRAAFTSLDRDIQAIHMDGNADDAIVLIERRGELEERLETLSSYVALFGDRDALESEQKEL